MAFGENETKDNGLQYKFIQKNRHQIHLLEIDPKRYKIQPVLASSHSKRQTVSSMVSSHKAVAGINGGFFYVTQNGEARPSGALKIYDWISVPIKPRAVLGWSEHSQQILIDRLQTKTTKNPQGKRHVEVFPQVDRSANNKKAWEKVDYIVGGTPLLIKGGTMIRNHSAEKTLQTFLEERHARTAVCIKKNGHWLWLVIPHTKKECRTTEQGMVEGFTISELRDFLQMQGCVEAINLDGGGSSTLVLDNKVKNTPAGDCDDLIHFYHERAVSDALLVFPRTP